MAKKAVIVAAVAGVAIIAIIIGSLYGMYFSGFNAVQTKDENVKKKWADIQTNLQRRVDLIPNLVESVKGYMQFERQTLEDITKLRSDWQRASNVNEQVQTGNQIESALSKILVTYENYPELKSNQNLVRLMDELAGTENRIAVARVGYNDAVQDYNVNLRTFPNNVFNESGFLGMSPWGAKTYQGFEATPAAQAGPPKVNLTLSQ
ncbi:MAG TPA: LemA family protein [Nitrososphaera sp.]|jgi:LemA protein|nr:LemA family protein [Nitrososphaera sp.]